MSVEVVELRGMAHRLVDNLLTGFPTGDLADAIDTVGAADALIVVTPVFAATDDWARASAPGSGAESPLDERIRRAATDLAGILNPGSGRRVAPAGHRRWSHSEDFTGSMEFGELLARARFPGTPAARRPGRRAG